MSYRGTRDGADSYAAREQADGVIGLELNGFEQGQNLACVGQNAPPGIGWLGAITTPIKQSSAQLALKRGDGMAQRRLRQTETDGGGKEGAFGGNRIQRP